MCRFLVLQEGKFLIPHVPQHQWNTGLRSSWKYRIHFSARTPNMGKATDACRASEAGFDELVIYPVSSPLCAPVWNPLLDCGMNLPNQSPVPFIHPWELSFVLGRFPVKPAGFCAGQDMIPDTWAWLWVTTASALTMLEHPSHCNAMKHQKTSRAWSCQLSGPW